MKKFIFYCLLLISPDAQQLCAQNIYSCKDGEMTFLSEAVLGNIDAASNSLSSVLNTVDNALVFTVSMRSFKFKKALMQEHFNEKYAESDKFPNAQYKGKINETIDYSHDGEFEITSTGTLTIHGVARLRTDKGKLIIKNGNISTQSEFMVELKDHNIKIPSLMFEYVAEKVKVDFTANYVLYKK